MWRSLDKSSREHCLKSDSTDLLKEACRTEASDGTSNANTERHGRVRRTLLWALNLLMLFAVGAVALMGAYSAYQRGQGIELCMPCHTSSDCDGFFFVYDGQEKQTSPSECKQGFCVNALGGRVEHDCPTAPSANKLTEDSMRLATFQAYTRKLLMDNGKGKLRIRMHSGHGSMKLEDRYSQYFTSRGLSESGAGGSGHGYLSIHSHAVE